jgi:hypothetical protein
MSDIKEAKNKALTTINNRDPTAAGLEGKETKNDYETILNCISDLINTDEAFSAYAKS